jgi:hypothetical protein
MDINKKILSYAKAHPSGFTAKLKDGKIIPVKGNKQERFSVANRTAIIYNPSEKNVRYYSPIKNNAYFGGWLDKSNGKYLIENTNLYSDKEKALAVARKRKQKAIFDLVDMKEIGLHYNNERPSGINPSFVSRRKQTKKKTDFRHKHREHITGIRVKQHRNVVYKHKQKYINRLTGKPVSKSTALRLNRFFELHPRATLYEAQKGVVYDKNKPWEEQNEKLYKVYHRENQLIKTKDRFGNDVYFSPLMNKRISKDKVKKLEHFDFTENGFSVHLYRVTSTHRRVYHIIKYPMNYTFEEQDDITSLEMMLLRNWKDKATDVTKEIALKYPIGHRDSMKMDFKHLYFNTAYQGKDNGSITVFVGTDPKRNNVGAMMPQEIHKAMLQYHVALNNYTRILVKEVIIYIFNDADEKNLALAETRIGILGRG